MSILFFADFMSGNVLDSFEVFENSLNLFLPFRSFLVSDAFSFLFAQIFQSLFLTFASVSSFFNKPSNPTSLFETSSLT